MLAARRSGSIPTPGRRDRPRRHHHAKTIARSAPSASSRSTTQADAHSAFENSGVIPTAPQPLWSDSRKVGMQQGYIERANVNPVLEMTKLIMVQHAFEAVTSSLKELRTLAQRKPSARSAPPAERKQPCQAEPSQA